MSGDSSDEVNSDVEVVVIGAGISGLAVAHSLVTAGVSVVVLEARDRVGGRLHAARSGRHRFDLGATWFWPGEARVQSLNEELGLAVHAQHLDGNAMFDDGAQVQRLDGNPLDVAAGRWTDAAPSLVERLADRLPAGTVRFGEAATLVEIGGETGSNADHGLVTTSTTSGAHRAAHVVIALPPSLAMARIDFEPQLPASFADLARITPVWMGAMTKVVATYGRPFWRERGLSGSAFSHRGPLREIHDMSGVDGQAAALFGFAPMAEPGGPSPEAVTAQLAALFGPAGGEPDAVHVLDWRAELHTSPADVERHAGYHTYGHAAYAQPLFNRRLHWSSTETSPVAPGHVEGALAAAERTANTILHDRSTKGAP